MMDEKNFNKKMCLIPVVIVVFIMSYFIFIYNSKINISEIGNGSYRDMFENVELIEVGNKDFSFTFVYEEDLFEALEKIECIKVKDDPLDSENTLDKDVENYICIKSKNNNYAIIYFYDDFVWIDADDNLTFLNTDLVEGNVSEKYKITNKEVLADIFKPLEAYIDKEEYENKYIDGRILSVDNDRIEIVEEYLDENIVSVDEWKQKIGDTYSVSVKETTNQYDKFRVGDKVRIAVDKKGISSTNVIEEVENIYYLNEFLVIKDFNDSKFFSKDMMESVTQFLIEDMADANRQMYSLWYIYNDEVKAQAMFSENKYYAMAGNNIENDLVLFFDGVVSHTFYGDWFLKDDTSTEELMTVVNGHGIYERDLIENRIKYGK